MLFTGLSSAKVMSQHTTKIQNPTSTLQTTLPESSIQNPASFSPKDSYGGYYFFFKSRTVPDRSNVLPTRSMILAVNT